MDKITKTCTVCNLIKDIRCFSYRNKVNGTYKPHCKNCISESDRLYRKGNSRKEYHKFHYENNKNRIKERQKTYYRGNTVKRKEYRDLWKRNNRSKLTAYTAKRRALKLKATPSWANLKKIEKIYKCCKELSELTGIEFHVDHIIPLKGKDVCGLHVEYNLQIITATENLRKNRSYCKLTGL